MRKSILLLLVTLIGFSTNAQNNMLHTSTWVVGQGSVSGFTATTPETENVREMGTDPFGANSVIWKGVPDAQTGSDGGWYTDRLPIDNTKTYRLTVWMKKTNSNDGSTLFGLHARDVAGAKSTLELNGTLHTNPYFFSGDLPQLNTWYLLVGYVHEKDHTSTGNLGGLYDINGTKVLELTDFKFSSSCINLSHRVYLYHDTNTADRQYFFAPTLYEVNGQEPTLFELLNPTGGTGQTIWNTFRDDINYTLGNVGIGTTSPDAKLTVKGDIHAEEVKVDLSVPAPDYVFREGYDLKSLEEVQNYIQQHGHLPNIPSAKEMEENGIKVGEISMKLLEKIEELVLYTLAQEKKIQDYEKQLKIEKEVNKNQEARISKLEKLLIK